MGPWGPNPGPRVMLDGGWWKIDVSVSIFTDTHADINIHGNKFEPSCAHGGHKGRPTLDRNYDWALMGPLGPSSTAVKFDPWWTQTWTPHRKGLQNVDRYIYASIRHICIYIYIYIYINSHTHPGHPHRLDHKGIGVKVSQDGRCWMVDDGWWMVDISNMYIYKW
jgi:hypothetical protein